MNPFQQDTFATDKIAEGLKKPLWESRPMTQEERESFDKFFEEKLSGETKRGESMTPEQEEAKRRAVVMLAFSEGKRIEYFEDMCNKWLEVKKPAWQWSDVLYRVAEEPELAPLEASDIPPVCWIRMKPPMWPSGVAVLVTMIEITEIGTSEKNYSYEELYKDFDMSTDLKTWTPCRKEKV